MINLCQMYKIYEICKINIKRIVIVIYMLASDLVRRSRNIYLRVCIPVIIHLDNLTDQILIVF